MDSYFIYLLVSFVFALLTSYLYIYLKQSNKAIGMWGLSCVSYVIACRLVTILPYYPLNDMPELPMISLWSWFFLNLGGLFLLWGTYIFLYRRMPLLLLWGPPALIALCFICFKYFSGNILVQVLTRFLYGSSVLASGLLLLGREKRMMQVKTTGIFLTLWGAFLILNELYLVCFNRPLGDLPLLLLINVLLAMGSSLGLLILYFQRRLLGFEQGEDSDLQYFLHHLKTKAMVISTYTRAVELGVYPKGSLEKSLGVISSEAGRLNRQIQGVLYLNRLERVALENSETEEFSLSSLAINRMDSFRPLNPGLVWESEIRPVSINGDSEQWAIVLDNLFDNQVRYAKRIIRLSLTKKERDEKGVPKAMLRIWNDGPPISAELLPQLFGKYQKGRGGKIGLGLRIAKRIVTLYGGSIRAENEEGGVAFYIEMEAIAI